MTEGNRPVHQVRVGAVTASIFPNENDRGKFYSVTFQKSYKDAQDQWQNSTSFGPGDLLELAKAADMAHTHILGLKQESAATR